MRPTTRHLALALLLLAPAAVLCETAPLQLGSYPLPQLETEELVTRWLKSGGFTVASRRGNGGATILQAERKEEAFLVEIRPRSPLASQIQVSPADSATYRRATIDSLKSALERGGSATAEGERPAPPPTRQGAPEKGDKPVPPPQRALPQGRDGAARALPRSVRSQVGSVVCLEAVTKEGPVQFTGFVIDRSGLILSTAHDVGAVHRIMTSAPGEKDLKGKVVKQDLLRDLSLIKVAKSFDSAVSVAEGRRRLRRGDTVFTIGCPEGHPDVAQVGIADRPPALVGGQRLWQLHMEVQPGSSGSPVFDGDGRLVGVVKGRFRGSETRGFVIPLDTVREFLK